MLLNFFPNLLIWRRRYDKQTSHRGQQEGGRGWNSFNRRSVDFQEMEKNFYLEHADVKNIPQVCYECLKLLGLSFWPLYTSSIRYFSIQTNYLKIVVDFHLFTAAELVSFQRNIEVNENNFSIETQKTPKLLNASWVCYKGNSWVLSPTAWVYLACTFKSINGFKHLKLQKDLSNMH